jgi:aspartate/glutamate racemase
MSQLLEQAISEVRKLSESEQDAIAALIMEEIADERRWENSFAKSQEQLSRLAERARQEIQAGRVRDIGFDEL